MATLAEAIKDKRAFPDTQEIAIGDGLKITLGELRQFQEATGQDVAKQLQADREKLVAEQQQVSKAQEEVVALWTKLQEAAGKQSAQPVATGQDWTKDPLFAPIAEHLKTTYDPKLTEIGNQISQFQKAIGLGVKYVSDVISEMRYSQLPEEFRKETPYDKAVKAAAEAKFLDNGGVPDVRKVYEQWESPRQHKAEVERIRKEEYDRARQDLMSSSLARPSGLPVGAAPATDPNAPKTIRESFQKLKEDPQFLQQIYDLTGQSGQA